MSEVQKQLREYLKRQKPIGRDRGIGSPFDEMKKEDKKVTPEQAKKIIKTATKSSGTKRTRSSAKKTRKRDAQGKSIKKYKKQMIKRARGRGNP